MLRFILTGFGPFAGVHDNPTQRLIEILDARSSQKASDTEAPGSYSILTTHILEVSGQATREWLDQLYASAELAAAAAQGPVVVIHLGVDVRGTGFKLERQAANDATFRCPDQRGWRPQHCLIDDHPGCTLDTWLHTDLDVAALADHLAQRHHSVAVSPDAGRFVCNFTYYLSLLHSQLARQQAAAAATPVGQGAAPPPPPLPLHALFVHVPPAEALPLDQQLAFLLDLLAAIAASLTPPNSNGGQAADGDAAEAALASPDRLEPPSRDGVQA